MTTDDMLSSKDYVKWFRNSAPYINAHRGKTFVLMFDGEAIAHSNFPNIIHDIALLNSLGVKLVLVHGARAQIESRCAERGIDSYFEKDLRITNVDALECVKEAAGSLRADIEALLTMGVANSPMHGAQIRVCGGNFVIAKPIGVHEGVDYQRTGEVRRIDGDGINHHLSNGYIVLLSPIGYSPTGEVFNLALEDVATQTASKLRADKLIVLSSHNGLFDENNELIRFCELDRVRQLLATNINVEMGRQLRAIIGSGENGVARCHIINYTDNGGILQELFSRDGTGTLITQNFYERLRVATIEDVGGILEIIEPLENLGVLVKRSRELLEMEIHRFLVIDRDGMVIACAALYPYEDEAMAEIACVATHPDYRGHDRGERLLEALEHYAKQIKITSVFVLTTQTAHWFQEQGFVLADKSELPEKKKLLYNLQRNSKVFIKSLTI